jgi:hypothetical protein
MGDCYQAAGEYMMMHYLSGNKNSKLVLVHAEVTGQGPISGIRHGHAYILNGNMVIDKSNKRDIEMPKEIYYAIGNIGKNINHYSFEEFRDNVLKHGTWGPWAPEIN